MFSCEYCEIFKNTYFEEHLRMAAFDMRCAKKANNTLGALGRIKRVRHESTRIKASLKRIKTGLTRVNTNPWLEHEIIIVYGSLVRKV